MNGVLVLDKPRGMTSFSVVARVRKSLREKRVGHTGTLDPDATGVLVVCLGEATKLVPFLQDTDKEYQATVKLGVTTDTDDAGENAQVLHVATEEQLAAVTEHRIVEALHLQVGRVLQKPPSYSALKIDGQRLYDLSRSAHSAEAREQLDKDVSQKARLVDIYDVQVKNMEREGPFPLVTFQVHCGKGTYIRSMARILGEALGVGGHLIALQRLRVGGFTLEHAIPLDDLTQRTPFSMAHAIAHLPSLHVSHDIALRIKQGHKNTVSALPLPTDSTASPLAIFDEQNQLVAILSHTQNTWHIARGF